jgi:hypothetical protein
MSVHAVSAQIFAFACPQQSRLLQGRPWITCRASATKAAAAVSEGKDLPKATCKPSGAAGCTRVRKASVTGTGGHCRNVSSAYASQASSSWATCCRGPWRVRAKRRGLSGSPYTGRTRWHNLICGLVDDWPIGRPASQWAGVLDSGLQRPPTFSAC